jgi:mono/diheme cytochrome c family protein
LHELCDQEREGRQLYVSEGERLLKTWETTLKHTLLPVASLLFLSGCQVYQPAGPSGVTPQTRGHSFAQGSCAACHGVERHSTLSPNPQAPSFPTIVNRQGLTAQTLATWLRDAHNYPDEMEIQLDLARVDDLVAYMLTLRNPDYRPTG